MNQESDDLTREYRATIDAMRVAQTAFELRRGEVVTAKERVNRLRLAATDAESSAIEAKERWLEVFLESDGVLNHESKQLRSALRDANDLAEDYRKLLEEAETHVSHAELPALEAARDVDTHRRRALSLSAEIELRRLVEICAPAMARVLYLIEASNTPDNPKELQGTFQVEPSSTLISALNHALLAIKPGSIELPEDLRPTNIMPLRWADAYSAIGIQRRKAAVLASTHA
jgi:hypothetical protein